MPGATTPDPKQMPAPEHATGAPSGARLDEKERACAAVYLALRDDHLATKGHLAALSEVLHHPTSEKSAPSSESGAQSRGSRAYVQTRLGTYSENFGRP